MVDRLQDLTGSFFQPKIEAFKNKIPDTEEESEEVEV